ncbi:MAG: asparagine synthase-related protein [Haloarculaceae archaeon]
MRGADPALVRRALADRDPLPGTTGFAGALDGRLVRDVLGREPLYAERASDGWSHDPADLADPVAVPAGHVRSLAGREEGGETDRVWRLPDPEPVAGQEAVRSVRRALDGVLGEVAARGTDGLAVAFSGGVDSALLAARLEVPLYVAGFPGSGDVAAAREGARLLGREADLRVVELDHDRLRAAVPDVVAATGRTDPMDVGIALPLFLVARRAAADGHDRLALGQGADELFGGYDKVASAPEDPRVEADTVRGARREVLGSLSDQLPRDTLALRAAGVEPVTPLLDDRVVRAALALDGDALASDGERKRALRLAARAWLPDRLAFREKRALQYGSHVDRELARLARQNGFKPRMEDNVERYVASLVD